MYSMTMSDTCATHVLDKGKSESCLVKALAKHASESVLVVGELLCTGVQAKTERHTRNETREMCSCWGYKQQCTQQTKTWLETSLDRVAEMTNATETQAGGLDPRLEPKMATDFFFFEDAQSITHWVS